MGKNPILLYKILIVGFLVFFIVVGIQPAFAYIQFETDNSEFVEVTVSIFKTNEIRQHTLMLTQKQVIDFDIVFENFKIKINNAKTKKETIEIYNDMIVSFDEFGLLPNYININGAQQLITGRNHLLSGNKLPSKLLFNINFFFLIS
jgi:hypothetical protein